MNTEKITEMLAQHYYWQFRYERKRDTKQLKISQGQSAGMYYMLEACTDHRTATAIDEEARVIARQREASQWKEVMQQREMNAA